MTSKKPLVEVEHFMGKNISLDDVEFESLRPLMALQYPFELDAFQKQA